MEEQLSWTSLPSKQETLPIEKTDYGYVQRTSYYQPELYHEEVIELESPYVSRVPAGTQVFTFLVLGDQNAGKSTFLHAFTHQFDVNFLEITSYLPILSSSFINTRFYFKDDLDFKPMDEIPFIDTDLARASFVLTRESFEFFLNEFHIQLDDKFPSDTRYVVIQFIEVGGDHLDSIMHERENLASKDSTGSTFYNILSNSYNLLQQSRKTIYFINASTLFNAEESLSLQPEAFTKLIERIRFLNATFPKGHQILFYLSRVPSYPPFLFDSLMQSLEVIQKTTSTRIVYQVDSSSPPSIASFLKLALQQLAKAEKWHIEIVDVVEARHINEKGSLVPSAIINTLVQCFQSKLIHSKDQPESFVAHHLINCFKEEAQFVAEKTNHKEFLCIYWIDEGVFQTHVTDIDFTEVPQPVLIQKFSCVAQRLVEYGLCIKHFSHNHSSICAVLKNVDDGTMYKWSPFIGEAKPSTSITVRFPHYSRLFDLLKGNLERNIPTEFWLQGGKHQIDFDKDPQSLEELNEIIKDLEVHLVNKWKLIFTEKDVQLVVDTFFWLLEEWSLCWCIRDHLDVCGSNVFELPNVLSVEHEKWKSVSPALALSKEYESTVEQKTKVLINFKIVQSNQ